MVNILFILVDQLRCDALNAAGRFPLHTPNLDALAAEGAFFTHAFTPVPVCAPARQTLLSGRRRENAGGLWNYDFIPTPTPAPGEDSFSEVLAGAGYHCIHAGKWHASPRHGPGDFGYARRLPLPGYGAPWQPRGGWEGEVCPLPAEQTPAHRLVKQVGDLFPQLPQPWHLWMDLTDPHLPYRPSAPFSDLYDPGEVQPWDSCGDTLEGKPYIQRQQILNWGLEGRVWEDWAPTVARYHAAVSQLDDAVGRLLHALDASGQRENTLVIFSSDHGDLCGGHGMLDKHYTLYDDVLRVPLILRWPGVIPAGLRSDALVSNCLDIPPTLAQAAGLPIPAAWEGHSLLSLARGQTRQGRDCITATAAGQQFGLFTQRALRTATHKYVWNPTDVDELYDLTADPGEKRNLAADPAQAGLLQTLRRRLYDELIAQNDPFLRGEWLPRQLLEGRKL